MSENIEKTSKGKKLIFLGFVTISILFIMYSRYQDPELFTPQAFDTLQRIAYGFYITMIASLGAITYGMYLYHKTKVEKNQKGLSTIIALVTWNNKSRKIFLSVFIGYEIGRAHV